MVLDQLNQEQSMNDVVIIKWRCLWRGKRGREAEGNSKRRFYGWPDPDNQEPGK